MRSEPWQLRAERPVINGIKLVLLVRVFFYLFFFLISHLVFSRLFKPGEVGGGEAGAASR